jgi:hypothetical protein
MSEEDVGAQPTKRLKTEEAASASEGGPLPSSAKSGFGSLGGQDLSPSSKPGCVTAVTGGEPSKPVKPAICDWYRSRCLATIDMLMSVIPERNLSSIVQSYSDLNALELELLNRSNSKCQWLQTTHRCGAWTLSYGILEVGRSSDREEDDDNKLPCCWPSELISGVSVSFRGIHLAVIPYAREHGDEYPLSIPDDDERPNDKDDRSVIVGMNGPDPSDELCDFVARFWEMAFPRGANGQGLSRSLTPKAYTDIVGADFYALMEERFCLHGMSWWFLPSDCMSCS